MSASPWPSTAHAESGEKDAADTASQRAGLFAAGGSVLTALAASACCWLPLGLIFLGVSAGGVSAWFERYRWVFLGITALLLGVGFYLVYFREPRCEQGSACAASGGRLRRFNRVMLWVATVFVIASASFPKYVGLLIPRRAPAAVAPADQTRTASVRIDGMTCEACAVLLQNKLAEIPGVVDAKVSYREGTARLDISADNPPSVDEIEAAVSGAGYRAEGVELGGG